MEIRKMTIDDYEKVYSLWLSCKGMGLNDLDDSREGIEKYLNRNPDTCFVACEGEEIIGAVLAGNDGRRGIFSHTAVSPDHRYEGIGKALVSAAVDAFRELGIHKVNLVVFSRNEAGNAFWEKMGFTKRDDLTYRNYLIDPLQRIDT
ncbi:MAG: GNAT family N-acetyltransferase [Erysipelotrichaceae bacterium]|nr:GNAT family N-acetyltransferase [Erysipelotrichaceae bacterium]